MSHIAVINKRGNVDHKNKSGLWIGRGGGGEGGGGELNKICNIYPPNWGAGIAQLVVLGLAATVSWVRYSSGDIFR